MGRGMGGARCLVCSEGLRRFRWFVSPFWGYLLRGFGVTGVKYPKPLNPKPEALQPYSPMSPSPTVKHSGAETPRP